MRQVGVAIIGAGAIALANHLPGLALSPQARLVAVCDSNPQSLENARRQTGLDAAFLDYRDALAHAGVDAVIVATPNFLHPRIVLAAVAAKKHVLCEKPLALDYSAALEMYHAAEAAGVRHMTAFTYRFVPAMRYLKHLVAQGDLGEIRHFRAHRFQDWSEKELGWRQIRAMCGTGELGDMLSHRIDYAHHLVGPIERLAANMRTMVPTRGRATSDVDDWVALMTDFESGATGVLESTKLATGIGEGLGGEDLVQINGSEASVAYSTQKPLELQLARRGENAFRRIDVPEEFLVWPGSPRDPHQGDPLATFRYDQSFEFIDAIVQNRPCRPSFAEGVQAQAVMDATVLAAEQERWVSLEEITRGVEKSIEKITDKTAEKSTKKSAEKADQI